MEEINLADMNFDFDDYFKRFEIGMLSEFESEEFDARVLGLFCQSFIRSKGDPAAIPRWVASHMCEQIYKVLAGDEFANAFRMPPPWQQPSSIFTRAEARAMEIFNDIFITLKDDPTLNTVDVIAAVASNHAVSYETARAAYYKYKKHLAQVSKKENQNLE